jgi:ATP-dependent helicase/nuclease subunit B
LLSLYYFLEKRFESSPKLSSLTIFLPSRRSANELKRIFIEKKKIVFLPAIRAIGDIDYDDIIASGVSPNLLEKIARLAKPALNIKYKLLLLGELMKTRSLMQSINLADELGEFLNEIEKNNCDLDSLAALAEGDYSAHWQNILQFLHVFLGEWKKFLTEANIIGANSYTTQIIKYYAENFNSLSKLENPIIIAGNLATNDVTIDLIKSLKKFPNSYFIFKGFDSNFDEEQLECVDELHKDFYFYNFLKNTKIDKSLVENIEYGDAITAGDDCRSMLNYSAMPHQLTHLWRKINIKNTLENIELIECEDIFEELRAATIYILDFISKNSMGNIAVVCDLEYSHQLELFLGQYKIPVNNSFGKSFASLKFSELIFLLNDLAADDFPRDAFLSFLKNPRLKYGGKTELIERLEKLMLNNPINAINFNGYRAEAQKSGDRELVEFLENIKNIFSKLSPAGTYRLSNLVDLQFEILENILDKGAMDEENDQRIIDFLISFKKEAEGFREVSIADYNSLLKYFLGRQSYSEAFSVYPAVNIIGAEESRLINYDLTVIFNCNEGFFPPHIPGDPWLNNSMRKKIGLKVKNCETGARYYDFIQLLSQKRVLITRSVKINGAATFKSRFLQRLESFLRCGGFSLKSNEEILKIARFDGAPKNSAGLKSPKPEPIFNFRNIRSISATNFNVLMKNPYDFYAKYALGLRNTNVLEEKNRNATLGTFLHKIFESFIVRGGDIETLANQMLDEFFYNNNSLKKLCREKVLLMVKNFYSLDKESRKIATKIICEEEYSYFLRDYDLNITAKADRIEFLPNNSIIIADYKTGAAPRKIDIVSGDELQLPFTALLMKKNNFDAERIEIWSIKYNKTEKIAIDNGAAKEEERLENIIGKMEIFLRKALDYFINGGKFAATSLNAYSDYIHLSRVEEWLYGA